MSIRVIAILLLLAACFSAIGQEEPKQRSGGYFANLFQFEFAPGKTDEALSILESSLIPAYRRAGIDVTLVEDLLGTKDIYLLVELKSGPEYYSYDVPPQDMAAWQALHEIVGEEGEQELDRFVGYLVRQSQTMVFVNRDEPRQEE